MARTPAQMIEFANERERELLDEDDALALILIFSEI
jgi:hypothetical protein